MPRTSQARVSHTALFPSFPNPSECRRGLAHLWGSPNWLPSTSQTSSAGLSTVISRDNRIGFPLFPIIQELSFCYLAKKLFLQFGDEFTHARDEVLHLFPACGRPRQGGRS